MVEPNVTNTNKVSPVSWGAIFAGVVIILAVQLLLALLGLAIGLWTINPTQEDQALQGIGVGAGIWWVLSSLIAIFAGGWVAGRLCGFPQRSSIVHGLVTWGLATLLTVYLLSMGIGSIVGGAFSVLQGGFGAIAGAAQSIGLPQQVQQQIQELTKPGGAQLTQAEQQQILQTARRFFDQDGPTPADRQQVAALLSQYANMSEPQARQMIDQWLENYEQATQALKEGAEKTAQALGTAAFWSFIMLLLTGIAAAAGAAIGTRWRLT